MAGYGDDAGFTAYTTAAGYIVPAGTISAARQRGSVYIDGTFGYRFPGVPVAGANQDRAWPRTGAVDYYGNVIAPAAIPVVVVNASYEAALIELQKPGSLAVITSMSKQVSKLKAGSVEIDYANGTGSNTIVGNTPMSTLIAGMLFSVIGPEFLPGVLLV